MRLIVLVTSALLSALGRHPAAASRCNMPTIECRNGLFNRETCQCDCIKPFCRDAVGECSVTTSNCGGNPWAKCETGRSCPWWPSALTTESCTTGPNVPPGVWTIHETRAKCCQRNFPGSDWCIPENELEAVSSPTKYPTIVVEEDDIEIVPLRFDLVNVPEDGLSLSALKAEMTTILKRVLVRLSERVDIIRITKVEETVRALYNTRGLREVERRQEGEGLRDVTMYFDVHVVRVDGMRFGPIIVQEIQDSYSEITRDIRSYSDENLLGSDFALNLCTSRSGKFNDCISDEPLPVYEKESLPNNAGVSNPTVLTEPTGEGLAGWAVALIILWVLALLFCIGGLVEWYRRVEDNMPREKHVYNKMYFPTGSMLRKIRRFTTNSTYQDSSRSRSTSHDHHLDGRGRAPQRPIRHEPTNTPDTSDSTEAKTSVDLILSESSREDPTFDFDHFTINTYATRSTRNKRVGRDPTMYIPGQEDRPDPEAGGGQLVVVRGREESSRENPTFDNESFAINTTYTTRSTRNKRVGRDPTMYILGQDRPDPEAGGGQLVVVKDRDDGRRYHVDPPLRVKRDPSSYETNRLPDIISYDLSSVTEDHDMSESYLTNDMEDVDESYLVSYKREVPRSEKKERRSQSKQKSFPV